MPRRIAPLAVPAVLAAVAVVAVPGCPEEDSGDEQTAATSESDGEVACEEIEDEASCIAQAPCRWDGVCHIHCPNLANEASCVEVDFCYWTEEACDYGGV